MRNNLAIASLIAVAAVIAAVSVIFFSSIEDRSIYAVSFLIAALVAVLFLAFKNAANASSKVKLMVEAIRNNDFSMRFHDKNNNGVNRALEKISAIIRDEKQNARRNERYYGLIMDKVNAGIFAADEKGKVELCNDGMLKLLGVSAFTYLEQLERIDKELKNELYAMQPGEVKMLSYKMKNGENRISASRSMISFERKMIDIFVLNNIYHVINSNEVEAWVKLTRVLTHEIMNSIAPINSLSEQLGGCTDGEKLRQGLEVIHDTSSELMKFTENYRRFAILPAPVCRLVSVNELVNRMIQLFKGFPVEFDSQVLPQELIINADEALIGRVIANLLKNSIESDAAHIRIAAYCINEQEQVAIDVSDDGKPIDDQIREQIFVPFFTTKAEGSGIGLSVSRRIMSMHNGSLHLIQLSPELPNRLRMGQKNLYTKTFRMVFQ